MILSLLSAGQAQPPVSEPLFPPAAQTGGTAVFAVQFDAGSVRNITTLFGQEPFLSSGKQDLTEWKFAPGDSGKALVVICYRRPELFPVGGTTQDLSPSEVMSDLPFPKEVVEPAYPPNTVVQGGVVLLLEVAKDGSIGRIEPVKQLGPLTQASIQAVKEWKFEPASDRKGNAVSSQVYAVLVFRTPLFVPTRTGPR
ncbi:MAG TPA: energy transducer TonB [Acidobacteriota bacterium]|nr:energy transducer TonB [Acidobacteriota bacterium]